MREAGPTEAGPATVAWAFVLFLRRMATSMAVAASPAAIETTAVLESILSWLNLETLVKLSQLNHRFKTVVARYEGRDGFGYQLATAAVDRIAAAAKRHHGRCESLAGYDPRQRILSLGPDLPLWRWPRDAILGLLRGINYDLGTDRFEHPWSPPKLWWALTIDDRWPALIARWLRDRSDRAAVTLLPLIEFCDVRTCREVIMLQELMLPGLAALHYSD